MNELTNQEKIQIIGAHQKNLSYNQYNLQVSIIEESSRANPNQANITDLNNQISDISKQLTALDAEIAALNTATN